MRKFYLYAITTMIVGFIVLIGSSLSAQEVTVPEPEFINSAIFLQNEQVTKLEKAIPYDVNRRTVGSLVTGMHASESLKRVNGTNSNVRLPLEGNYNFIVRVASNDYDPFGAIGIIKMETTRNGRRYKTQGTDMLGQSKSGDLEYVAFEGRKYGESSYHIQITQDLAPGEYAIILRYASDVVNCFGVGEIGAVDNEQTSMAGSPNSGQSNLGSQQRTQNHNSSNEYINFQKGTIFPHIATGLAWKGGVPFVGGLDYMITDDISLGAEFSIFSFNEEFGFSDPYTIKYKVRSIGVRGAYHVSNTLDISDPNWDLYGGIYIGTVSLSAENEDGDTYEGDTAIPGYTLFVGNRYLINEKVALFGEISYGLVFLKLGLSFKI